MISNTRSPSADRDARRKIQLVEGREGGLATGPFVVERESWSEKYETAPDTVRQTSLANENGIFAAATVSERVTTGDSGIHIL